MRALLACAASMRARVDTFSPPNSSGEREGGRNAGTSILGELSGRGDRGS